MSFATNFKRICTEKGTSPTKVVLSLGLSSSKVNQWNNGGMPKADIMVKIAQALDCNVMDFFDDEDLLIGAVPVIPKVEFALDEDEKDIIRLFRKLSRKDKHEFMSKIYWYEEQLPKEEQ